MNNVDQLIGSLAASPPRRVMAFWPRVSLDALLATLYVVTLVLFYSGARPDLAVQLTNPLYALEIGSLYALMLSSLVTAQLLGYPDLQQRQRWLYVPLWLFGLFVLVMFAALVADQPPAPPPDNEIACTAEILEFALLPAAYCLFRLRGMATTRPALAGAVAVLAAFSVGALVLRLAEETDAIGHVIVWHYLPGFGVALLGVLIGKRLLRW